MADQDAETASAEALREEIKQLRSDMAAIARTLKDMGAEEGKIYEGLRDSVERAKGEAEQAATTLGRQIEERPLTAVVAAFILGSILGALISRR
jgi:ElaB/YqjD/DUF883 family membrane-anchored ribosome-binding protein